MHGTLTVNYIYKYISFFNLVVPTHLKLLCTDFMENEIPRWKLGPMQGYFDTGPFKT